MNDNKPQSNKPAKEDLLNELQSIKGLLDETPIRNKLPDDLDIPTLEDIVDHTPLDQHEDLDIAEITSPDNSAIVSPPLENTTDKETAFAEDADLLDLASIFEDSDTQDQEQISATDDFLDSSFNFELDDLELDELTIDTPEPKSGSRDTGVTKSDQLQTAPINVDAPSPTVDEDAQDEASELTTAFNLDDLDTDVEIPNFKLTTELSVESQTSDNSVDSLDDEMLIDDDMELTFESDNDLDTTTADQDTLETSDSQDILDQRLQEDYEEEQNVLFPTTPEPIPSNNKVDNSSVSATVASNNSFEEVDIDLLIQEIVDEFIPILEDELRQKLSNHSPEVIRQLAKKYLDK